MAKRRIHLTESQLHRLIEQSINELDWKTYMNAGKKAADDYDDRAQSFIDAAAKAYRDKYGAAHKTEFDNYDLGRGEGHNPNDFEETRTDSWYEGDDDNGDYWYGVTRTTFPSADDAIPRVSSEYAEDYEDHIFNNPTRNRQMVDWPWFEKSEEELSQTPPEFRDVHNYEHGKSKYTKGKGWNEAVAHAVTENVIRVIKEGIENSKWTCDEFKDGDYGTYTIQGSWNDYTLQELSAILEDIMVDYVGRDLQDNVENYADDGYDNYECVFVKSADDYNPDDGTQICKGYPLSIKLYLKVSGGVEGGVDGDYAYNTWWSAIEEVRGKDSGVDVFFASVENQERESKFLLQAVDGIDWEKVKNSVKPRELEEEDTDFDWAEYEQGLADDAAEARYDSWKEDR